MKLLSLILALFATSALAVDIPVKNPSSGGALTVDPKVNVAGTCGNGNVCSGTYTPTSSSTQNVDAVSIAPFMWLRVGNVMTVAGVISIDATSAGTVYTHTNLSLPFTRPSGNFANGTSCSGTGGMNTSSVTGNTTWTVVSVNGAQRVDLLAPSVVSSGFQDISVHFTCTL